MLSGFLITYLLLSEQRDSGRINVPFFYIRRILRIWPMYFLVVLIGFVLFPLVKKVMGEMSMESHSINWYLLFLSNFEMINKGFADSSLLNVLWSVSVEEQFYLIWPLLVTFSPQRHLLKVLGLVVLGTVVFRNLYAGDAKVLYYHTLAVIGDMAIGGVLAWLTFSHAPFTRALARMPRTIIAAIYAIGFFIILFNYKIFTLPALAAIERYVYALFFAFVIAEQNFAERSLFEMSRSRWLSKWGHYTYGLYCLHSIAILLVYVMADKWLQLRNPWQVMVMYATLGLGLSMVMAWVSYHYIEAPFLALKNRFQYFMKSAKQQVGRQ